MAVLAAAILFGTTGTSQALGPDDTTPLGVGSLRIAIGALTLCLLARSLPRPRWRRHTLPLLVAGIGVAAYQPTFFTATDRAGVALATIVALGSGPVFAGLLELLFVRRRPTYVWLRATAIAVTGGVLLVAAQGGEATLDWFGVLCAAGAGLSYAVYAIAIKVMIDRGVASTMAMAGAFTVGALMLAPLGATQPLGWVLTPSGLAMVLWLGVATVGVAYALYGYGLRTLPTSSAVTLTLAEPVTAAVLGVVVLDERLPALGWIGAGLVCVGLALTGRRPVVPEA